MYNRYVRDADGNYQRRIMGSAAAEAPAICSETDPPKPRTEGTHKKKLSAPRPPAFPVSLETGDLLVLLILLLILTEGEEADKTALLITICAFLMLQ